MSNDTPAEFEIEDLEGSTVQYNSTVASAGASLPASANFVIAEVKIRNMSPQVGVNLMVSWDGTNYETLKPSESSIWSPKGRVKQIKIKSSSATISATYESTFNYKPFTA
jgi:hypothetical protein